MKNLVVLLGSGASFHLCSPRTRDLANKFSTSSRTLEANQHPNADKLADLPGHIDRVVEDWQGDLL